MVAMHEPKLRIAIDARVFLRGGGDLASGIILRLARSGLTILVAELAQPVSVRRLVSFSQAVYEGQSTVEGITAVKIQFQEEAISAWIRGAVPVMVDPEGAARGWFQPDVVVDARMRKTAEAFPVTGQTMVIGLGPGFCAPVNCHAVIETKRGPYLGRVIWDGSAEEDTGEPDGVNGLRSERVLRSPAAGVIKTCATIGERLEVGSPIAEVSGISIRAPFTGYLRGLLQNGIAVEKNMKIGDMDPRDDPRLCHLVSDKALAVGGGVLEAILTWNRNGEKTPDGTQR